MKAELLKNMEQCSANNDRLSLHFYIKNIAETF